MFPGGRVIRNGRDWTNLAHATTAVVFTAVMAAMMAAVGGLCALILWYPMQSLIVVGCMFLAVVTIVVWPRKVKP